MARRLLETLSDRARICVLLRSDGWSYGEIAEFLSISERLVRHELEKSTEAFPGLLDHRRPENKNRLMRLVYLSGISDAGGNPEEFTEHLDGLVDRAKWLRARTIARDELVLDMKRRKEAARGGRKGMDR